MTIVFKWGNRDPFIQNRFLRFALRTQGSYSPNDNKLL